MRALLLLAALVPAGGAPVEPLTVVRTFASELELTTETFELVGSDQRMPQSVREQAEELEIVDVCDESDDPLAHFTREYRAVATSKRLAAEGRERPARTESADLEGLRVVFEREDDGTWSRTSPDESVRPVQLQRLRADLSLSALLPPDEVEEGASHALEPDVLARVLAPLAERHRRPRVAADPARGGLDLAPAALVEPIGALLADAEGTLTVTPRARGEDDELPRNATLAFELTATFDGSAGILRGGGDARDEVEVVYEGTGTLAWDPEDGRIVLALDGALELDEHFRVTAESGGRSADVTGTLAMSGTLALEAEERRE